MPSPAATTQLADLLVLAQVLERGSFARAAVDYGVPPSTLSRRIAALERRLGLRLIERTTRQLRATEIGAVLAERGGRLRRELEDAERAIADHQLAPRGLLRLSMPTPVADDFIGPALADYLRRYPEMRVEVVAENGYVDLVAEGFDAALRIGKLGDSSMGVVRLGTVRPALCASRRYLDGAPPLRTPRDLREHATIGFGKRRKQTWSFVGKTGTTQDVELTPRAVASNAPLVAQLAAEGIGLASIPRGIALGAGLVIVEPGGFRPHAIDLGIVTPSARPAAPKVRAFIDLMRAYVATNTDLFDAPARISARK